MSLSSCTVWLMGAIGKVRSSLESQTDMERGATLGRVFINLSFYAKVCSCSEGFNFNLYKPYMPIETNSQGRKQMHAELENCVKSLRQMGYTTFMNFMKVFFGLTNLRNISDIKK